MKTLELLPPAETMYRALVNRDQSFEGIFYIGVRTTGIFCRRAGKRLSALLALPPARSKRPSAEVDRAPARGSGARAGRTPHGQGTGRALDRSFNRASTVQAPLWNDIPSVSSRAPNGSCFEPGAERRSRGSGEKREWL